MNPIFSCFFSRCSALVLTLLLRGVSGTTFAITNRCDFTVWPGILSNAGSSRLETTGFELSSGGSRSLEVPVGWSGRFWGRSGCTFDATGHGNCTTGDCGSGQVECNGAGAIPPATLAEFTIGSGSQQDFYDVSLVDGYNLPMIVEASGGTGSCASTGCVNDLNQQCPAELKANEGQACNSACGAFAKPEYCCSGAYGSPTTCKPSVYSEIFKTACPKSYSYAYDDATSTFTCSGANYMITFCPSLTSQKSSRDSSPVTTGTPAAGSSAEDPTVLNAPWLSNFITGDSSRTLSSFALHSTLIASATSSLLLFFLSL
ncbi:hypothetical protein VitviT2T_027897 [Vitis vinifera]|uniref:Thaumatin-like protein 1 n=2 Tax=Vitis vinifera TaxID=29760 RepID=A0ABY9DTE0_VITVI|eukprot:XP_010664831.1 PREDICTED: thaumatin-like protein 1b [Vitis vinifera]